MTVHISPASQEYLLRQQADAARNEKLAGECLKIIRSAPDAEKALRKLLQYLGESLSCDRVYVFEEMDRHHMSNTYEWCAPGVASGIDRLPYVAKKDLHPWYGRLEAGETIIQPVVEDIQRSDPFIHDILSAQDIRSIVLSPLLSQGRLHGLLGVDNPPPEELEHISVLFDVLAYFVCSLVDQRELTKLRSERLAPPRSSQPPKFTGKTLLLVDDSPELLRVNKKVLRPEGYNILTAATVREAHDILKLHRPDAVILDIDLPDSDGVSFCRELRRSLDVPVIFLTAHTEAKIWKAAREAGGDAVLTKPYDLEELRSAVAAAVAAS